MVSQVDDMEHHPPRCQCTYHAPERRNRGAQMLEHRGRGDVAVSLMVTEEHLGLSARAGVPVQTRLQRPTLRRRQFRGLPEPFISLQQRLIDLPLGAFYERIA